MRERGRETATDRQKRTQIRRNESTTSVADVNASHTYTHKHRFAYAHMYVCVYINYMSYVCLSNAFAKDAKIERAINFT